MDYKSPLSPCEDSEVFFGPITSVERRICERKRAVKVRGDEHKVSEVKSSKELFSNPNDDENGNLLVPTQLFEKKRYFSPILSSTSNSPDRFSAKGLHPYFGSASPADRNSAGNKVRKASGELRHEYARKVQSAKESQDAYHARLADISLTSEKAEVDDNNEGELWTKKESPVLENRNVLRVIKSMEKLSVNQLHRSSPVRLQSQSLGIESEEPTKSPYKISDRTKLLRTVLKKRLPSANTDETGKVELKISPDVGSNLSSSGSSSAEIPSPLCASSPIEFVEKPSTDFIENWFSERIREFCSL